jgi:hypothetical protein
MPCQQRSDAKSTISVGRDWDVTEVSECVEEAAML